jgi:hypothetical protein
MKQQRQLVDTTAHVCSLIMVFPMQIEHRCCYRESWQ